MIGYVLSPEADVDVFEIWSYPVPTCESWRAPLPDGRGSEAVAEPRLALLTVPNRHPQPAARSLRSRLSQWAIAQITDSEPRPEGAGWWLFSQTRQQAVSRQPRLNRSCSPLEIVAVLHAKRNVKKLRK